VIAYLRSIFLQADIDPPSSSSDISTLARFFNLLHKLGAGDAEVEVEVRSQGSIALIISEAYIETATLLVA
jgi:hypothetical protein